MLHTLSISLRSRQKDRIPRFKGNVYEEEHHPTKGKLTAFLFSIFNDAPNDESPQNTFCQSVRISSRESNIYAPRQESTEIRKRFFTTRSSTAFYRNLYISTGKKREKKGDIYAPWEDMSSFKIG